MTATFMSNPFDTLNKFADMQLQDHMERNKTLKINPNTKNQGTGITPPPIINNSTFKNEDIRCNENNDKDLNKSYTAFSPSTLKEPVHLATKILNGDYLTTSSKEALPH